MRGSVVAACSASLLIAACGRIRFDGGDGASSVGRCLTATFSVPGASSLADDFSSAVLSGSWRPVNGCIAPQAGELVAAPPDSGGYCHVWTSASYHLSCDGVTFEVPQVTASINGAQTYIYVQGSGPIVALLLENDTFHFTAEVSTDKAPYDPAQDLWWKLRESDGTLFFETSPDQVAWRQRLAAPDPFSLDAVTLAIGAGVWQPIVGAGQAHFRCYNMSPPCT
jgi:hypothetical protein